MTEPLDPVMIYAKSRGLDIRPRTVIVEGTSDVALFEAAARLEAEATGIELIGEDFAIVAAGARGEGGVNGVVSELHVLRSNATTILLPGGKPKYRFLGLLDNDWAGRGAVQLAKKLHGMLEYKDIFRIRPEMPKPNNLSPDHVERQFEDKNAAHKQLDWEIEDFIPDPIVTAFLRDQPTALICQSNVNDRVHREYTQDGKHQLHRFAREHAIENDLAPIAELIRCLRHYMNVKPLVPFLEN
jgi:hypothetical protein